MSYEGYSVRYCIRGHRMGTRDAYECVPIPACCPVCGCLEFTEDHVDQTNGCFCDELPESARPCPAHETELKLVGWTPIQCPVCLGSGVIQRPSQHLPKSCDCGGNPCCEQCHGSGRVMVPSIHVVSDCDHCKSLGHSYVKKFDVSPLQVEHSSEEEGGLNGRSVVHGDWCEHCGVRSSRGVFSSRNGHF